MFCVAGTPSVSEYIDYPGRTITWRPQTHAHAPHLAYQTHFVDIEKDEQFQPDFLAISPNNKTPALVDHDADGGSLSIFESGAILTGGEGGFRDRPAYARRRRTCVSVQTSRSATQQYCRTRCKSRSG
jgi:hypothetical protein